MKPNVNHLMTLHSLTVEEVEDSYGKAIMLTQSSDGYNEPDTVLLHPWQLRAVCEELGVIAADEQAAKTIATLRRRMLVLRGRIDQLAQWMAQRSDHNRADLSHEMTSINALADLAGEWCVDFDSEPAQAVGMVDRVPSMRSSAPDQAAQGSLL